MRIEFEEKIKDITEEEKYRLEEMNIQPKDRRFKWRKIWLYPDAIFALKEINDNESIIEFNDASTIIVKGSYAELKAIILKAEDTPPEEE